MVARDRLGNEVIYACGRPGQKLSERDREDDLTEVMSTQFPGHGREEHEYPDLADDFAGDLDDPVPS